MRESVDISSTSHLLSGLACRFSLYLEILRCIVERHSPFFGSLLLFFASCVPRVRNRGVPGGIQDRPDLILRSCRGLGFWCTSCSPGGKKHCQAVQENFLHLFYLTSCPFRLWPKTHGCRWELEHKWKALSFHSTPSLPKWVRKKYITVPSASLQLLGFPTWEQECLQPEASFWD